MTHPTTFDIKALHDFYQNELLQGTLPFWFPRALDTENGGFYHCFDEDGSLVDTDKSVWAQGRMSWMLLTLYNDITPNSEWLAWAESGLNFITQHCQDTDGRLFFHVTADGQAIRKRRYAFSECFAAIAFAAHAGITGNPESRKNAEHYLNLYLKLNFEPGAMAPKFEDTRPAMGLAPRIMTIVTLQEFRKFLGDSPFYTEWIDRCIDDIKTYFYKPELNALMEMVTPKGDVIDHFDGRTLNPGHGIEGAWFILREAEYRENDPELISFACSIIDMMFERGWDTQHGGLLYFVDVYNKPVQEYWQKMKFWWPHDETLIATLMAYSMTGNEKYAQMHQQTLNWSMKYFQDPKHGEWYGYLNPDGSISSTLKGSLWKSFFHHPRALYMCYLTSKKLLESS